MWTSFAAVSAVIACAVGQVELSSTNNDAVFQRDVRQEVSVFDLQQQISTQATMISSLQQEVSRLATTAASAAVAELSTVTALNSQSIGHLSSAVDSTTSAVAGQLSIAAVTAQASENRVSAQLSAASLSMEVAMDASEDRILSSMDALAVNLTRSVDTRVEQMSTSLSTTVASVAAKKDDNTHMWTGGCNSRGGGWVEYCLNIVEINTAAPWFVKHSNTRFRALRHMYFDMYFFAIKESCNWSHMVIYVDGRSKAYMHGWQGSGHWWSHFAHIQYRVLASKQFYARAYSGCYNAWHQGGGSWHSRVTVVQRSAWNGQ